MRVGHTDVQSALSIQRARSLPPRTAYRCSAARSSMARRVSVVQQNVSRYGARPHILGTFLTATKFSRTLALTGRQLDRLRLRTSFELRSAREPDVNMPWRRQEPPPPRPPVLGLSVRIGATGLHPGHPTIVQLRIYPYCYHANHNITLLSYLITTLTRDAANTLEMFARDSCRIFAGAASENTHYPYRRAKNSARIIANASTARPCPMEQ